MRKIMLMTAALLVAGAGLGHAQGTRRNVDPENPGGGQAPADQYNGVPPTSAYQGGPDEDPRLELPFLAYYTANGNKRFCDGRPPSDVDKDWARLYVRLTTDAAAVEGVLSR